MKTIVVVFLCLLASNVWAQSSPSFDPDVYLPKIGDGIDTIQGHDTSGFFGSGIINLGPAPGTDGFGRIAMQGLPGNKPELTTIKTGHSFDLHNLQVLKKLNLNFSQYRIDHWGHLHNRQCVDIIVDQGNDFPIIYWGDSNGNYDASRFTKLNSPKREKVDSAFGSGSGAYATYLSSDTIEDIVWMIATEDFPVLNDSLYLLHYKGGEALYNQGETALPDSVFFMGHWGSNGLDSQYRQFSQGDWRGVGREDLIAVEKTGGNWHYYRNDRPFRLDSFAHAMLYDTVFFKSKNHGYTGMYENQRSMRALPKAGGDKSFDLIAVPTIEANNAANIYIFRGGPNFGTTPIYLDSAEGLIHSPDYYDANMTGLNGFGGIEPMGDMTGTGNPVVLVGAGIGFTALDFFYVLGKASDTGKKVDMYYTDEYNSDEDSLTSDMDNREDMLMGSSAFSRLMLFHGSDKIPVHVNAKYSVVSRHQLAASPLLVYPNPAQSRTILTFETNEPDHIEIVVRDVLGRELQREERKVSPGIQQIPLSLKGFANGTYIIQVQGRTVHLTNRVAIVR